MTASKYWGDERHDDAIYAVYLKKVRYMPPQQYEGLPHYRPIDPDSYHLAADIDAPDHLQWETIRERIIKAGTLGKIVESLFNPEEGRMDSRQFHVFFSTFRAYSNSEMVLNKFIEWYETISAKYLPRDDIAQPSTSNGASIGCFQSFPESITDSPTAWTEPKCPVTLLATVRSILNCWLDAYPEDFYALNAEGKFYLLARLIDFARQRSLYDLKHKARKIRERFKRVAEEGGLAAQIPSLARYSYANAVCYDPHDLGYARHRAQMFDVSRDNCVQIAEQLTFWDAVLFRELRPYQCQGAIWGKRHKSKDSVYSVCATIDQFNSVCHRVMTSIVFPDCTPEFRAKITEKWIEIARELKSLKNFSSLKAIISALQTVPVFRIKTMWNVVSKASMAHFKQLAAVFETNNDETDDSLGVGHLDAGAGSSSRLESASFIKASPLRNILGSGLSLTSGLNTNSSAGSSSCQRSKSDVNLAADSHGTVPFLGKFITDLVMIDQAHKDKTEEGLINFEKRRREFEIFAKIRLFQSSARSYTMPMDQAFCIWFYYLPCIDEKECFTRSLEVEPNLTNSTPDIQRRTQSKASPFNGIYSSSPSTSASKFYSLTKMFTGSGSSDVDASVNSTPATGNGPMDSFNSAAGKRKTSRQTQAQDEPQKPVSFVGQRSNDSGILTEVSSSNNNDKIRTEDLAFSTAENFYQLDNAATRNGCVTDACDTSSSLPPTPLGTFSARTGAKVARAIGRATPLATDCSDYGSEFNPVLHFSGPFSSRQTFSETCCVDLASADPKKSHSSSSSCSSSFGGSLNASLTPLSGLTLPPIPPAPTTTTLNSASKKDFHLARVGLDDSIFGTLGADASNINYKCIKVENGDRMTTLIDRALEKHMINIAERVNVCLVQLLPDGSEFKLPDNCNPFYAVAPDPTSPMLNFLLKRHFTSTDDASNASSSGVSNATTTRGGGEFLAKKKLNKEKRSNLLRWSSGYL